MILRKFIQPMESALELIPKIVVRDSAVDALCHGASLTAPGVVSVDTGIQKDTLVAVLSLKGEAVTLSKATEPTERIVELKHGVVAAPERVLIAKRALTRRFGKAEAKMTKNRRVPAEHYFISSPKSEANYGLIRANMCGRNFEFVTASSVFSKRRIDTGTQLLIESMSTSKNRLRFGHRLRMGRCRHLGGNV